MIVIYLPSYVVMPIESLHAPESWSYIHVYVHITSACSPSYCHCSGSYMLMSLLSYLCAHKWVKLLSSHPWSIYIGMYAWMWSMSFLPLFIGIHTSEVPCVGWAYTCFSGCYWLISGETMYKWLQLIDFGWAHASVPTVDRFWMNATVIYPSLALNVYRHIYICSQTSCHWSYISVGILYSHLYTSMCLWTWWFTPISIYGSHMHADTCHCPPMALFGMLALFGYVCDFIILMTNTICLYN